MLTVFHHSLPPWAAENGGWKMEKTIDYFMDFTRWRPPVKLQGKTGHVHGMNSKQLPKRRKNAHSIGPLINMVSSMQEDLMNQCSGLISQEIGGLDTMRWKVCRTRLVAYRDDLQVIISTLLGIISIGLSFLAAMF